MYPYTNLGVNISFIPNKCCVHLRVSSALDLISLTLYMFHVFDAPIISAADLISRYLCEVISYEPVPQSVRTKA